MSHAQERTRRCERLSQGHSMFVRRHTVVCLKPSSSFPCRSVLLQDTIHVMTHRNLLKSAR